MIILKKKIIITTVVSIIFFIVLFFSISKTSIDIILLFLIFIFVKHYDREGIRCYLPYTSDKIELFNGFFGDSVQYKEYRYDLDYSKRIIKNKFFLQIDVLLNLNSIFVLNLLIYLKSHLIVFDTQLY